MEQQTETISLSEEETEEDWPCLVDESRNMLEASVLVYGVSSLRNMARKGQLDGDNLKERILDLPITVQDCLDVASANREKIQATIGQVDYDFYGSVIVDLRDNLYSEEGDNTTSSIEVFDDENSESELVYAIGVNKIHKRILLAFRGSVTVKDFMVDADGYLCQLKHPLKPDSKETLGIHHGFYEYLNGSTADGATKFKTIMNHLATLFKQHQGYRLYTTGHSLGGSLAILFAGEAASSTEYSIPMPITCVTFASPKVGDVKFRTYFESLETAGSIRCVRYVNSLDIVPSMPNRSNCSCFRNLSCQPPVYQHVGPRLILFPGGEYEVAYGKTTDEQTDTAWWNILELRWSLGSNLGEIMSMPALCRYKEHFLVNHSCQEYTTRFNQFASKGGKNLYLKDLYTPCDVLPENTRGWSW